MDLFAVEVLTFGGGFLKGMRYVIHDRDPLFTDEFRRILRDAGVKPIKLPAQSPDLNAFAESLCCPY